MFSYSTQSRSQIAKPDDPYIIRFRFNKKLLIKILGKSKNPPFTCDMI